MQRETSDGVYAEKEVIVIQHGNPPFTECSSKGFRPFSAFYAQIRKRGGRTIEEIYQGAKVFEDGSTNLSWKQAKGIKAVNQEECNKLYSDLWNEYIEENLHLHLVLKNASGLSDMFGQEGHCCQATELWRIRRDLLEIN